MKYFIFLVFVVAINWLFFETVLFEKENMLFKCFCLFEIIVESMAAGVAIQIIYKKWEQKKHN